MKIKEAIQKLLQNADLTAHEAGAVMDEIMTGQASHVQTAAYLVALSAKGETIEEVTGSAERMRSHALQVEHGQTRIFEIVGTGGDGAGSFNISTTSAMVIAAAGVKVAKHGNRAASSRSGAADCLEALGVNINLSPAESCKLLEDIGMSFLFAQTYHKSMKYVAPVRKELEIRTIFNLLGPLTNPARATEQLLGVYSEELVEPMARVLSNLGVKKGMVVYGQDGIDEISVSAPTMVCFFENGVFLNQVLYPEDLGFKRHKKEDLKGGDPKENAAITRAIFEGELGPKRDAVLLNAGAGLFVAGVVESIKDGVHLAAKLIDEGIVLDKLTQLIIGSRRQVS